MNLIDIKIKLLISKNEFLIISNSKNNRPTTIKMSYSQQKHSARQNLKEKMITQIQNEISIRKTISEAMKIDAENQGLIHSRKLSLKKEKFFRYCYNFDSENAKLHCSKVKELMMEIFEYDMEACRDGETDMALFVDENASDDHNCDSLKISKGEGGIIQMGQCMKDFDEFSKALLYFVENLK